MSRTTRTWKEHTDWKTGKRTLTAKTTVENNNTHETTVDDYTSESTLFGAGPTAHWDKTGGHQTVTVTPKGGQPKKTLERDWDWIHDVWVNKELSSLIPTVPQAGNGAGTEQVFAPGISGPGSQIVATVVDPTQSADQNGPSDQVVVQFDDKKGGHHFFRSFTDPDGHLNFRLPAYAAAFELFKHFTADRKADPSAAKCLIDSHATVPVPMRFRIRRRAWRSRAGRPRTNPGATTSSTCKPAEPIRCRRKC